jgi:hypothetical protein
MLSRFPAAILLALALSGVAQAQPHKGPGPNVPPHLVMERLSRMTPGERDRLFSKLPAERRSLLEERLDKYNKMPSEAKERLREEFNSFQQLPAEKQEEVRKLYKQFSDLPEDRRPVLRRELHRLRGMPADRRARRMSTDRFRSEYSEAERALLAALVEILERHPGQAPPAN